MFITVNPIRILLIALFLLIILVACDRITTISPGTSEHVIAFPAISGQGSPLQNPYPEPEDSMAQYYGAPLPAVLVVGDQEQIAAIGSSCWTQVSGEGTPVEACLESPGIPTPQVFLPGEISFRGRLRLPLPYPPASLSVYSMQVTPADTLQPPADGTILWPYREGQTITLANDIEQDLQLELEPGLTVLYINARWEGLGSVGYGFLVDVVTP
jgi:hypothetical protein